MAQVNVRTSARTVAGSRAIGLSAYSSKLKRGAEFELTYSAPVVSWRRRAARSARTCSLAKHLLQIAGVKDKRITVLEATGHVGGTWRYVPYTGRDRDDLPIYTSMYKNLRTNLPTQVMEFPDCPMGEGTSSYPTRECFYDYIIWYAKRFNLQQNIKFHQLVTSVKRHDGHWLLTHKDVLNGTFHEERCDYLVINNGRIVHSHDYREPEPFRGRRVMVVGAGPSGWDISLDVAKVATKMVHSHHSPANNTTPFPENYIRKPNVKGYVNSTVIFADGSTEEIDDILYCTGYQYYYPFLDDSSGLERKLLYLAPLYKNLVNIRHPTMMFMGLGVRGCVLVAIHTQARYLAALFAGKFSLPSEEIMQKEWDSKVTEIHKNNKHLKTLHDIGPKEKELYDSMTDEANITRVRPIIAEMYKITTRDKLTNWYEYRSYRFTILDDNNYTRTYDDTNAVSVLGTRRADTLLIPKRRCKMLCTLPVEIFVSSAVKPTVTRRFIETVFLTFMSFFSVTTVVGRPERESSLADVLPHLNSEDQRAVVEYGGG
ncbi:Senecionine N-oxygenase [Eumeta japonica]|uniref:Flavin-containing monooxygenase n=1 Tax=Eumeta variegata TaxID=151549 RepID=A0A4C1XPV0_EUMVA|nr:Senecionine N-oxygenase [Eumeta japonica]